MKSETKKCPKCGEKYTNDTWYENHKDYCDGTKMKKTKTHIPMIKGWGCR